MIETRSGIRIEVDLARSGVGAFQREALERAMLNARGGYAGIDTGIVDAAEVRGDSLVFTVAYSEGMARDLIHNVSRDVIAEQADALDLHDGCVAEDDSDERVREAHSDNDRWFGQIVETLSRRDVAGVARAIEWLDMQRSAGTLSVETAAEHFRADR